MHKTEKLFRVLSEWALVLVLGGWVYFWLQ